MVTFQMLWLYFQVILLLRCFYEILLDTFYLAIDAKRYYSAFS